MIDEIDGYYLLSLGFPNKRIVNPEKTINRLRSTSNQVQVQLLNAGLVAGPEHLRFAARNALHSFRGKDPKSKSLAVEYLLYVSCQRQISKAIRLLGIEEVQDGIVVVALSQSREALVKLESESKSIFGDTDDGLIEVNSKRKIARIQKAFGVAKKEMDASRFEGESEVDVLKRLIVERSALLDIRY
jgi:KEOPS complex subunit Cgi121